MPRYVRRKLNTYCGARWDRTSDLLHAVQALSQLSYGSTIDASRNFYEVHELFQDLHFTKGVIIEQRITENTVCRS